MPFSEKAVHEMIMVRLQREANELAHQWRDRLAGACIQSASVRTRSEDNRITVVLESITLGDGTHITVDRVVAYTDDYEGGS